MEGGSIFVQVTTPADPQARRPAVNETIHSWSPVPAGRFHVAACWEPGGRLLLFVNGKRTSRDPLPVTPYEVGDRKTFVGGLASKVDGSIKMPLEGVVDELRVSSSFRYSGDFTPATRFESDEHTRPLYHFDEGRGDVLRDASGNDHHGKITGATWVKADPGPLASPGAHPVDWDFVRAVERMAPEEQVAAVTEKLRQLNPEFDGEVIHEIDKGGVVKYWITTNNVTDISPVRALQKLASLGCNATGARSRLSDLSPPQGLRLQRFECQSTAVTDLSALAGMPLSLLNCWDTSISDLSPLQGMQLEELNIAQTQIRDLTPLSGMPLRSLTCGSAPISDISPLRGMPLQDLTCNHTGVSDLTPVADAPLVRLRCGSAALSDLSPLRSMRQLRHLEIWESPQLSDLTPLAQLPLTYLYLNSTAVTDLSPLGEILPLTTLFIDFRLYDGPTEKLLRSLPLEQVNSQPAAEFWRAADARREAADEFVRATAALPPEQQIAAVADRLRQLNDGPPGQTWMRHKVRDGRITELWLRHERGFGDLTPLRALTGLRKLQLDGFHTYDLSPLTSLPLEELSSNTYYLHSNAHLLRTIPTLQTLNGRPAAEVLSRAASPAVDEAFVRTVAGLPPEEQVKAVTEKLKQLNPGFDGKVEHVVRDGQVFNLTFLTDGVVDISPVRALSHLERLTCRGSEPRQGLLNDLSPLKGLPLSQLDCSNTRVDDLSPLSGSSLKELRCNGTPVADLSPLSGVPLELLSCGGTAVADLSPLGGTPLEQLVIQGTQVTDLSPLRETRLQGLWMADTSISDLRPLAGLRLETLSVSSTPVGDLSPLRDVPLVGLHCEETLVADLSPLRGKPLRELKCNGMPVADLSPLEGMPLRMLFFDPARCGEDELRLVRSLPLELINDRPAGEFWAEFDARLEALRKLLDSAAGLPPERLVAEVQALLQEFNGGLAGPLTHVSEDSVVTRAASTSP